MMIRKLFDLLNCSLVAVLAVSAVPARAQDQGDGSVTKDEAPIAEEEGDAIVVIGRRARGEIFADQAPVIELEAADIAAFGASSLEDLLDAIAPQTTSSRGRGGGRPVFLVNGIRIGSFRELRSYPPEAIEKVQVLPEEVAQRFGFEPDRRVVNLILKDRFSSQEIEAKLNFPDRGGYHARELEWTSLRIRDGGRINFNAEIDDTSPLSEAQRSIVQPQSQRPDLPSDPDPAVYRTLVADSFNAKLEASYARASIEQGSAISFNASYERSESKSLSGLNTVLLRAPDGSEALRSFGERTPLFRRLASDQFSGAASYNRPLGDFQLSATVDTSHLLSVSRIARRFDTSAFEAAAIAGLLAIDAPLPEAVNNGFDIARSRSWSIDAKTTLNGPLAYLPAGDLMVTLDLGYGWDRIDSSDSRTLADTGLTRGDLEAGLNLSVPIASRRDNVWDALGSFSLNLQGGINHLSDFGKLHDASLGLNWSPFDNLDLQATRIWRETAPSLANLGNPRVESLNVPIYDFASGQTVLATVISGGNPLLPAETQKDWKFSANWELPFWDNTRASVEYIRNHSRHVTSSFPLLTPIIEAAFPDRVVRDGQGALEIIDQRPIAFDSTRARRLVLGLVTRGSFGRRQETGASDAPQGEPRAGGGPASGPRGAPRGAGARLPFGRDGLGRYFVNLTHTIEIDSQVLVAPGGPLLDLLGGDVSGDTPLRRHSTRLEMGAFRNGLGLRLSGRYQGKGRIDGGALPASGALYFDDIATFDLRFFADLGRVAGRDKGFFKGLRLALSADNLFDARQRVSDASGATPLSYQPFLIDPTGRFLGVELRKMF